MVARTPMAPLSSPFRSVLVNVEHLVSEARVCWVVVLAAAFNNKASDKKCLAAGLWSIAPRLFMQHHSSCEY